MKSHDDIKKGLECCWGSRAETGLVDCGQCPYWGKYGCPAGKVELGNDALALIQQKEAESAEQAERIKQLEAERDAMKEALGLMVYQYCVSGTELDHRYMCAGETAFRVLGLEQYGDTRTLESWLFPECQDKEE